MSSCTHCSDFDIHYHPTLSSLAQIAQLEARYQSQLESIESERESLRKEVLFLDPLMILLVHKPSLKIFCE